MCASSVPTSCDRLPRRRCSTLSTYSSRPSTNTQKAMSRSRSAAAPRSTMCPRASARAATSARSRVLPMPAAPTISSADGFPEARVSRASSIRRSSSRRPTKLSAIVEMRVPTISGCCPDVESPERREGGAMPNPHSTPMRRLKQVLLVLCAAQLMVILDITAVNVALPDLARGLGIEGGDIGWTITSYSLIFGSLLLLGGRAADLVGRRRMFMTGLAVFTLASIAAATAGGAGTLFAARGLQGLGAAMLSPAALSILMSTFREGTPRAHALAAWGAVGGAGAAVGVLLGGALTELVGWQAIFLINVPVGLGLAVAARRLIAPDAAEPRWSGFDLRGAALATTSLGAIVYALSQSADAGWSSTEVLGAGAAGVAGLIAFVIVELRATHPLLRIDRLADRGVGGGLLTMLAAAAVLFGLFLLSSLYLQNVLGAGPLEPGLSFLPLALALAAGVHVGSKVMMHAGVRVPMAAGFAATAAGMLLLS